MSKVLAWKCDDTGGLFEDETDYRAHRRRVLADKRKKSRGELLREARREELNQLHNLTSLRSIEGWLVEHADLLEKFDRDGRPQPLRRRYEGRLRNVTFLGMTFSPAISNSHSAPLGKQRCYKGGEANRPRHFPGFEGCITLDYDGDPGYDRDWCREVGICTGTGGGGGARKVSLGGKTVEYPYSVSFQVTIWVDDFHALARRVARDHIRRVKEILASDEEYIISKFDVLVDDLVRIATLKGVDRRHQNWTPLDHLVEVKPLVTGCNRVFLTGQSIRRILFNLFPGKAVVKGLPHGAYEAIHKSGVRRLNNGHGLADNLEHAILVKLRGDLGPITVYGEPE